MAITISLDGDCKGFRNGCGCEDCYDHEKVMCRKDIVRFCVCWDCMVDRGEVS